MDVQRILAFFEGLLKLPHVSHRKTAQEKAEDRSAFWCSAWLTAGLLAAVAAGIYATLQLCAPTVMHNEETFKTVAGWIEFFSITAVGLLLLAAGLFHFRGYRHAYEVHVETNKSMIQIFSEAGRRLDHQLNQPSDLPAHRPKKYRPKRESRAILTELGADALAENSDWAATHHSRPLEPPLG
jgi:hypothetical protein